MIVPKSRLSDMGHMLYPSKVWYPISIPLLSVMYIQLPYYEFYDDLNFEEILDFYIDFTVLDTSTFQC